jgi:TetR/AcrR family transcriptional repressor of nem operon
MPRTRTFNEGELLDAAIELFWTRGYNAVSLADISARTGVANGSLYQAFGSKGGLFLVAFRRYCSRRAEMVAEAVSGDHDNAQALVSGYFEAIIRDCADHEDRRGCLMLNSIAELAGNHDVAAIAATTIERMNDDVAHALAEVSGRDPRDTSVRAAAAHTVSLSQAMIHLSRIDAPKLDSRQLARHAADAVQHALQAA